MTITLWFLISLGTYGKGNPQILMQFRTEAACVQMAHTLWEEGEKTKRFRCVKAEHATITDTIPYIAR